MALAQIYRVVQDLEGNVVTGVLGTVILSGTSTLASLFADADGTIPLPNPTTNNAQYGSFALFVDAGTYTMQFVKAGFTFETQYNITMRDPAAGVNSIVGTANRILVAPASGVGTVTLSTPQDLAPDSSVQFAHIGVGTPATSAPIVYADPPAARIALGLGTMAQQDASAVAITGGYIRLPASSTVGGLYIEDVAGTARYGIRSQVGAGTDKYNVFADGTAPNYFGGRIGVLTVDPGETLHVTGTMRTDFPNGLWGLYTRALGAGTQFAVVFQNSAAALVGSITHTDTTTSYGTTSDARLKHAITALSGALAVVQALRPVAFRWNSTEQSDIGFLAHELMVTAPNAVTGQPDEVNDDGSIRPQQVDNSKLVPILVGALKELLARVEVLEQALA